MVEEFCSTFSLSPSVLIRPSPTHFYGKLCRQSAHLKRPRIQCCYWHLVSWKRITEMAIWAVWIFRVTVSLISILTVAVKPSDLRPFPKKNGTVKLPSLSSFICFAEPEVIRISYVKLKLEWSAVKWCLFKVQNHQNSLIISSVVTYWLIPFQAQFYWSGAPCNQHQFETPPVVFEPVPI